MQQVFEYFLMSVSEGIEKMCFTYTDRKIYENSKEFEDGLRKYTIS